MTGAISEGALAALPKVELHVHLEGSIRHDTAAALARRHGEDPDEVLELVEGRYPRRFADFGHFVRTFTSTSRQVRTPEDLFTVAAAFARGQADDGVTYTETTVTALGFVAAGMEPSALWQALSEGLGSAPGVTVSLIVDVPRDEGVEAAARTVELVEGADAPIVGLGLSGIEGALPERDFHLLRDAADRLGLGLSVHAGETGGPDRVRAALDELGADRIGHGIATADDDALLARVVREQVPLEVCPSSNVVMGIVAELDAHPLPRLLHAGANVTISSDDPPFFATSLDHELRHAARLADLDVAGMADLQRRAAGAAFASRGRREAMLAAIDAWEAAHRIDE